ncbi:hypothetical protein C0Q70_19134 [Pomacea canaliculata]|uniref:CUB domain-containing protein n=1 Tax=Pomacea canaliculata TaxID=400727 RepID=A0A2T7NIG6_POMCA|nr:hypothetical protein C0Q70_19134 [Pomacea canaliculata]
MAAVAGNFLLVLLTTCLPLTVLAAYYPSHWYLKDNCGANRVFSRSLVLGYSYKRYSTLLRNWDCPLTLRTADPTRGIQVRFRYLDTTQSDDCSQARLTVSDTHGPLTYSDGVCGKSSRQCCERRTTQSTSHCQRTARLESSAPYPTMKGEFIGYPQPLPPPPPYPDYLSSQCQTQILFQESVLVSYSLKGYTTIPPNYNCLLTIQNKGRGIQVRFRKLQTTYSPGCSQVKLLVDDKSKSLTPPSGVCGFTSPQTVRTTRHLVFVKLVTDNTTIQYGDFELLFTEFTDSLNTQCGTQISFRESMLLKYSDWGYSTIPSNYNCQVTILSASPGRGIQVRFRTLETTISVGCSQVRLTVGDRTRPLTPTNGVCGFISPPTARTTDDRVYVTLTTDNTFLHSGYFELLLTEFNYLVNDYLDKQCGWQLVFPESLLLKYSDRGYTSIPPNYNCLMTIAGSSPGRGLQVRFRKLETADTVDCSQVRLTVSNRTGPLTPTNGVCGFTSPQTVRTTDDSVDVRFATDNTTSQSGYFELLLTEFTYAINAVIKFYHHQTCDHTKDFADPRLHASGYMIGTHGSLDCLARLQSAESLRSGRDYRASEQDTDLSSADDGQEEKGANQKM